MVIVSLLLLLLPFTTSYNLYRRYCGGSIRHVHLAVGADPSTSMTVSFASIDSDSEESIHGAVLVGRSPHKFDQMILEEEDPIFYTSMQPKYYKGASYSSPYQHHITITGLTPRSTYYYLCITRGTIEELLDIQDNIDILQQDSEAIAKKFNTEMKQMTEESEDNGTRNLKSRILMEQSLLRRRLSPPPYDSTQCICPDPNKVRSFQTMAPAGHGYPKLAVIGDIGQFPHSEETWDHLRTHHGDIDAIILAGDLAYPELDHNRWDTFMDFLDDYPLVERVPMHITPGNHDIGKPENGTQIFAAFEARFRMPRIQAPDLGVYSGPLGTLNMDRPPYPLDYDYGNAYYAFQYGKTHQIFLNSYSAMEPGSKQYEWLIEELDRVNRRVTPWLLVTYHVPIYNTFEVHQHDAQMFMMREHIEPLLVQYKVNVVINGHIHAYERTKPVAFGKVTKTGPIHIVMGAGGRAAKAEFLTDTPEDWVEVRDGTIYGYGLLEICNKTHARWDWVHTGARNVDHDNDHDIVHHENVTLPPGGVDHTFFENQYFMTE